jgi:hypothetical protein
MRAKRLLAPSLAVLLAGCQAAPDSGTPSDKPSKSPAKDGGLLSALKPPPLIVPEDTTLHLVLETALSSATSKQGDLVVGKLADDVKVGEKVVLPEGTELKGQVTAAVPSGRVKGLARLAFDFDRILLKGTEHPIETRAIDITADNTHKRDAAIIGGGTAGGAIIGAVTGGKKGAGIGALIGAATGTGVVLTNKGKEVKIPSGTQLGVKLTREAHLS